MNIFWSERALKDIESIIDYYALFSEDLSYNLVFKIYEQVGKLTAYPEMGQIQALPANQFREIRYLVESNWKILYSLRNDVIYIETIFDTRQDPLKMM